MTGSTDECARARGRAARRRDRFQRVWYEEISRPINNTNRDSMLPQPKRAKIQLLHARPTPADAESTTVVRRRLPTEAPPRERTKSPTAQHPEDKRAEPPKRKTRPHKAVVFNNCVHAHDGSFRFNLVCFCLRSNMTYTTEGRRESELLNLARFMRRVDMKCGHSHKFVVPYPLNTSKPVRWPKLSLRR